MTHNRLLKAAALLGGMSLANPASACGPTDYLCQAVSACYGLTQPSWGTHGSCAGDSEVCLAYHFGGIRHYWISCGSGSLASPDHADAALRAMFKDPEPLASQLPPTVLARLTAGADADLDTTRTHTAPAGDCEAPKGDVAVLR